ncbi:MAG: ATP-binding protein [Actinobacteria bacterium]|nr:ATP-binding protein [Actinomycetota bacterium]
MNLDVGVCLPQDAETVALIRGIVGDTLAKFGLTRECIDDIQLALSEACTNVVDHAAADDEYEVRFEVDDRQCQLTVKNTGAGFDADSLSAEMPDGSSARGRGVAIMRAVMDGVDFRSEPEAGTIVHLVKAIEVVPGGPLDRLRRRRDQ